MNPKEELLAQWSAALTAAGIVDVELLACDVVSTGMSGEARFRWSELILRLRRERFEDFVDVASVWSPGTVFKLSHVGIAFGWRQIDSLLELDRPVPLPDELGEIVKRRVELEAAFAPSRFESTKAAIGEAAKQWGAAVVAMLRERVGRHH